MSEQVQLMVTNTIALQKPRRNAYLMILAIRDLYEELEESFDSCFYQQDYW